LRWFYHTSSTDSRSLEGNLFFPFSTQVKIVIACAALHNWILEDGPDEYVYDDVAWYVALPRSTRNHSDMRRENPEWSNKRDEIANKMWEDRVGQAG
jgi:hypothetical protein